MDFNYIFFLVENLSNINMQINLDQNIVSSDAVGMQIRRADLFATFTTKLSIQAVRNEDEVLSNAENTRIF
jgi:hypothetical protein